MQKIKAIEKFINPETQEEVKSGDVLEVEKNTAHTLIDKKLAKLFTPSDNKRKYSNKQMTPKRRNKKYITK